MRKKWISWLIVVIVVLIFEGTAYQIDFDSSEICEENEIYHICSRCEPTCTENQNRALCKNKCLEGCFCKESFVRLNRNCVTIPKCEDYLRATKKATNVTSVDPKDQLNRKEYLIDSLNTKRVNQKQPTIETWFHFERDKNKNGLSQQFSEIQSLNKQNSEDYINDQSTFEENVKFIDVSVDNNFDRKLEYDNRNETSRSHYPFSDVLIPTSRPPTITTAIIAEGIEGRSAFHNPHYTTENPYKITKPSYLEWPPIHPIRPTIEFDEWGNPLFPFNPVISSENTDSESEDNSSFEELVWEIPTRPPRPTRPTRPSRPTRPPRPEFPTRPARPEIPSRPSYVRPTRPTFPSRPTRPPLVTLTTGTSDLSSQPTVPSAPLQTTPGAIDESNESEDEDSSDVSNSVENVTETGTTTQTRPDSPTFRPTAATVIDETTEQQTQSSAEEFSTTASSAATTSSPIETTTDTTDESSDISTDVLTQTTTSIRPVRPTFAIPTTTNFPTITVEPSETTETQTPSLTTETSDLIAESTLPSEPLTSTPDQPTSIGSLESNESESEDSSADSNSLENLNQSQPATTAKPNETTQTHETSSTTPLFKPTTPILSIVNYPRPTRPPIPPRPTFPPRPIRPSLPPRPQRPSIPSRPVKPFFPIPSTQAPTTNPSSSEDSSYEDSSSYESSSSEEQFRPPSSSSPFPSVHPQRPPCVQENCHPNLPVKKCRQNEKYLKCGTRCPQTCRSLKSGKNQWCNTDCIAGCFCIEGFFRNEDGRCVKSEECTYDRKLKNNLN